MHRHPRPSTRREFLATAAGAMAFGLAIPSCRRKPSAAPVEGAAASDPINLDEVENAASFRPPLPGTEPIIRVRVARFRGNEPANSTPNSTTSALRIGTPGQWIRLRRIGEIDRGIALASPVQVMMLKHGWSVVDEQGFRPSIDAHQELELSALSDDDQHSPPANVLIVEHTQDSSAGGGAKPRTYCGSLRLVCRPDLGPEAFDVVNHIPLETYLPGVLAGELYRHWHFETFAAQAVAARSFVCTEAAVFAGRRHYDVTNTASSQVYLGKVDHPRSLEAVAATRGLLLAYEGLLVSGYYSSCCGGIAASAIDAIGSNPVNDVAPLRGRSGTDVCHEAPVFRWKVEHPLELLCKRINAFGADRRIKELSSLAGVANVEIAGHNVHGRPTRMRLIDREQSAVEISAENFRRAANHAGAAGQPPPPERPLRSSNLRASFARDSVTFEGFGFGHGVGLCQYGAEALARDRMDHQKIVRWYYPGVELVAAYA